MDMSRNGDSIGRRSYLKKSAAGFGLAGFSGGALFGSFTSTITIPILSSGDKVVLSKKVPKTWYNKVEHASKVNKTVTRDFINSPGVVLVGTGFSNDTIDGKRKPEINVEVDPKLSGAERSLDTIPESVDGIRVHAREGKKPETLAAVRKDADATSSDTAGCVNNGEYNNIYGGIIMQQTFLNKKGNRIHCLGTICARVRRNGSYYMLTARHIFGYCNETRESAVYQSGSLSGIPFGRGIGNPDKWNYSADYALVDKNSEFPFRSKIEGPNGWINVGGRANRQGVIDLHEDGGIVHKTGAYSGYTSGSVLNHDVTVNVNDYPCINFHGQGVVARCDAVNGDSGGPLYQLANGEAWVFSVMNASSNPQMLRKRCGQTVDGRSYGFPAYPIYNDGYRFA